MNDKRYRYTLYLIATVIAITIGIQLYWNYNNYLSSKQQLINEVQISLDKAVDDYYGELAKRTTVGFAFSGNDEHSVLGKGGELEMVLNQLKESEKEFTGLDSLEINITDGVEVFTGFKADSMMKSKKNSNIKDFSSSSVKRINIEKDSAKVSDFKILTSKVMVSINNDALDVNHLDSLLKLELNRKQIRIDYKLHYEDFIKMTPQDSIAQKESNLPKEIHPLNTISKSTFLPEGSLLSINFSNETLLILRRILSGILISTILILAIISSLFYLLKIIRQQKQLAEVKNDLISNITHEFKTPIATIGVALESIKDFNGIEDKERTKKYLSMSSQQLRKLNTMVEKLLETATLDSEHLELNKEVYKHCRFNATNY